MNAPLLVELFTEELPPKALQKLGEAFAHGLRDELTASGLLAADSKVEIFATPRRLAARLSNVLAKAPDRQTEERLLPEKVGLDAAGKPTAALLKKLASLGRDESAVASIKKANDGKLTMLFLPQLATGQSLQVGLAAALDKTIARLPIPKVMSYQLPGSTETVKFVRPAHGLVALHGADVVNVSMLGLAAGRVTHGHRFLGERNIELKTAAEYDARLNTEGKVIADFVARRTEIESQLKARAGELNSTRGDFIEQGFVFTERAVEFGGASLELRLDFRAAHHEVGDDLAFGVEPRVVFSGGFEFDVAFAQKAVAMRHAPGS